ncbi:unnamed protein product [Lactuca saligna]|uniref:Uncharacterized protein n=1 Tax=Lactuca saligna TaxID=75948 RepID=A0AA35ZSL4_LACSI|nr:unnamed protein product [Lactuca saligna]
MIALWFVFFQFLQHSSHHRSHRLPSWFTILAFSPSSSGQEEEEIQVDANAQGIQGNEAETNLSTQGNEVETNTVKTNPPPCEALDVNDGEHNDDKFANFSVDTAPRKNRVSVCRVGTLRQCG